jgi:N-dimethylarginine dimethylaminohydrolase
MLAVGRGYRTNDEGIRQLRALLGPLDIEVMTVELPHWRGPGECLASDVVHQSGRRTARGRLPAVDVSTVCRRAATTGWSFIEVPDEEFETHGCNVLALAPKRVLVCDGSPVTRARLEAADCSVAAYAGDEISHNRAGGPTCLTRPILREFDTSKKSPLLLDANHCNGYRALDPAPDG